MDHGDSGERSASGSPGGNSGLSSVLRPPRRGVEGRRWVLWLLAALVFCALAAAVALAGSRFLGEEASGFERSRLLNGELAAVRGAGVGEIASSPVPAAGYASSGSAEPAAGGESAPPLGPEVNSVAPGEVAQPGSGGGASEESNENSSEGSGEGPGGGSEGENPNVQASTETPDTETPSTETDSGPAANARDNPEGESEVDSPTPQEGSGEDSGGGSDGEAGNPPDDNSGGSPGGEPAPEPAGGGDPSGDEGGSGSGGGSPGESGSGSDTGSDTGSDADPPHNGMRLTVPALARADGVPVIDGAGGEEAAMATSLLHLAGTGFPWEEDEGDTNTYIAGHRLGYQGTDSYLVFYDLDKLRDGDRVFLEDASGRVYEYRVYSKFIVEPSDTYVANPVKGKDIVTLQTCTLPDYSERLVVQAERV